VSDYQDFQIISSQIKGILLYKLIELMTVQVPNKCWRFLGKICSFLHEFVNIHYISVFINEIKHVGVCRCQNCICTLQVSMVNFTIYGLKLPASSLCIYKEAFVIFLKVATPCYKTFNKALDLDWSFGIVSCGCET
jgi:hypothetical protein